MAVTNAAEHASREARAPNEAWITGRGIERMPTLTGNWNYPTAVKFGPG